MALSLMFMVVASYLGHSIAAPYNGLQPYNINVSLISHSTINKIEELVKQEVLSSLHTAYLGLFPEYPASSCKQLGELRPDYTSGYYWVAGDAGPTGVYCEMDGEDIFEKDGGWTRIGHADMTDGRTDCPQGLEYAQHDGKALCRRPRTRVPGCSSTTFAVHGIKYSKVCGMIKGYQYHNPNGFGPQRYNEDGINGIYLDGISITHGSPRQHVWSLAAARSEDTSREHDGCPCISYTQSFRGTLPSFVGENYYCETGSRGIPATQYYFDDPLWDGHGCEGDDKCCERGGPWFCTELGQETSDNIEMRVCGNNNYDNEDIAIESIGFFIH